MVRPKRAPQRKTESDVLSSSIDQNTNKSSTNGGVTAVATGINKSSLRRATAIGSTNGSKLNESVDDAESNTTTHELNLHTSANPNGNATQPNEPRKRRMASLNAEILLHYCSNPSTSAANPTENSQNNQPSTHSNNNNLNNNGSKRRRTISNGSKTQPSTTTNNKQNTSKQQTASSNQRARKSSNSKQGNVGNAKTTNKRKSRNDEEEVDEDEDEEQDESKEDQPKKEPVKEENLKKQRVISKVNKETEANQEEKEDEDEEEQSEDEKDEDDEKPSKKCKSHNSRKRSATTNSNVKETLIVSNGRPKREASLRASAMIIQTNEIEKTRFQYYTTATTTLASAATPSAAQQTVTKSSPTKKRNSDAHQQQNQQKPSQTLNTSLTNNKNSVSHATAPETVGVAAIQPSAEKIYTNYKKRHLQNLKEEVNVLENEIQQTNTYKASINIKQTTSTGSSVSTVTTATTTTTEVKSLTEETLAEHNKRHGAHSGSSSGTFSSFTRDYITRWANDYKPGDDKPFSPDFAPTDSAYVQEKSQSNESESKTNSSKPASSAPPNTSMSSTNNVNSKQSAAQQPAYTNNKNVMTANSASSPQTHTKSTAASNPKALNSKETLNDNKIDIKQMQQANSVSEKKHSTSTAAAGLASSGIPSSTPVLNNLAAALSMNCQNKMSASHLNQLSNSCVTRLPVPASATVAVNHFPFSIDSNWNYQVPPNQHLTTANFIQQTLTSNGIINSPAIMPHNAIENLMWNSMQNEQLLGITNSINLLNRVAPSSAPFLPKTLSMPSFPLGFQTTPTAIFQNGCDASVKNFFSNKMNPQMDMVHVSSPRFPNSNEITNGLHEANTCPLKKLKQEKVFNNGNYKKEQQKEKISSVVQPPTINVENVNFYASIEDHKQYRELVMNLMSQGQLRPQIQQQVALNLAKFLKNSSVTSSTNQTVQQQIQPKQLKPSKSESIMKSSRSNISKPADQFNTNSNSNSNMANAGGSSKLNEDESESVLSVNSCSTSSVKSVTNHKIPNESSKISNSNPVNNVSSTSIKNLIPNDNSVSLSCSCSIKLEPESVTITINTKKDTEPANNNSENDSSKKSKKTPVKNANCLASNSDAAHDGKNLENCEVMSTDSSMTGSVHLIVDETSINADLTSQTQFTNENSFQIKEEQEEQIESNENMIVDAENKQEDKMEIEEKKTPIQDEPKESPCSEESISNNLNEVEKSSVEKKSTLSEQVEEEVDEAIKSQNEDIKAESSQCVNQWIPHGDPFEENENETHKKYKSITKNDIQININDFVLIENKNLKKIAALNEDFDMANESRDTNYSDNDPEYEYYVQLSEIRQETSTKQTEILVKYLYKAKQLRDELSTIESNEEFDEKELICTNQTNALLDVNCIKSKCLIYNKTDYENWLNEKKSSVNGMEVFFYRYQYDFEQKTLKLIDKL